MPQPDSTAGPAPTRPHLRTVTATGPSAFIPRQGPLAGSALPPASASPRDDLGAGRLAVVGSGLLLGLLGLAMALLPSDDASGGLLAFAGFLAVSAAARRRGTTGQRCVMLAALLASLAFLAT